MSVQGLVINNLRFADDIDLIEEQQQELQDAIQTLSRESNKTGLVINKDKTKTLIFGQEDIDEEIELDGSNLENVKEFTYLGSLISSSGDCSEDIRIRITKGKVAVNALENIWKSKNISEWTKLKLMTLMRTCVFSVALYACDSWTFKKRIETE